MRSNSPTGIAPVRTRAAVALCPYELGGMGDCPQAVMRDTGGGTGICVFASVAKTDRGLDVVCHHPARVTGARRADRGGPPWLGAPGAGRPAA